MVDDAGRLSTLQLKSLVGRVSAAPPDIIKRP